MIYNYQLEQHLIAGLIKNNFDGRMTFKLGDIQQGQIVLGVRKKEDGCPTSNLKRGEFFLRENGRRVKYRALICTSETLAKAAEKLEKGGYNYKLKEEL